MEFSEKIITLAVERLNRILPLAANQRALDTPLQRLHRALLYAYVSQGCALSRDEMANYVDDLDEAVKTLKQYDLVVFNDNEEPIGAYPFTMEKRIHRVSVNGHTVHCMCALDALAVSSMFNIPATISSYCHLTNDVITIQQHGRNALCEAATSQYYVGINWGAASDQSCCADSLCTEMIFLKNRAVADIWLAEDPELRQIFSLDDAVEFAARFFEPLVKGELSNREHM